VTAADRALGLEQPSATALVLRHERIRISYADTDAAGIIYYAAWFPWMERLHTSWLFDHGIRLPELQQRCGTSVVTRATTCEYLAVVRPLDEIEVVMLTGRIGVRSYELRYVMTRPDDAATVAQASLTLAGIDRDGRSGPVPTLIKDLLTVGPATGERPSTKERL
jgi:acyl-CoA thioester hydrolase